MRATKKKDAEHVGMGGNVLLCDRCGSRYDIGPALPMPVYLVTTVINAWSKQHRKCTGTTKAFREASSVHDWIASDDTGTSSKAIYSHMQGGNPKPSTFGNHPHDPSDFGRCYRLLKIAPHWRERIGEMAKYGDVWTKLAAAWDELTALYEEELPSGNCPKLYARMKELGA